MITLYNENDVRIRDIRIYEINDADMGESTITATVKFDQVMQFHPDWYVLLNGEKYKLGITEPSGKRSTTRINVEYTLTFHSSREDLKRYTFMDFVEYGSGNPQPSQHTFSLQACTLGQLVNRFNINLQYYLGSLWTMELSKDADPSVVADLSFDKASLWDVLTELYKDYGVRWTIRSNEGYMTILVGKDATELQTIFEYGKGNGLISVERTNPTERIVTRLRGKGSEKNLPANYFHAETSAFPIADPDTNSILQGIFYNRLYPKCYRDYVRGYNSGEEDVEETWAYHQGVADKIAGKPMNIVDFAKSDNEALWGISYGAVEDNDEIYPTLQGATRNGVELDKVLAVSPIYVDAPDDGAAARQFTQVNGAKGSFQGRDISIRINGRDGGISSVLGISNAKSATADSETFTLETAINTVRAKFLVTPTKFADYYANAVDVTDPESPTLTTVVEMAANNWNFVERLQLINATTGDVVRTWNGNNQDFFDVVADDIPAGMYKFRSYIQWYKTTETTTDYLLYTIDWQLYGCEYASYQNASSKKTFSETFDIWIGNVWNTSKQANESDEAYTCRVWAPLVSKEEMTVMFSDGLLAGEDYEFPIVGLVNDSDNLDEIIKKAIHYDTSVTGSHWRLTLQKSDAEFEASGKYLPNSVINVLPGNHFFFINIQMPYDPYIYDAERRQQEYLEDQLSLLDVEQPTFAVVPSSVFMASLDEVDNVVPGNKIRLRDAALIGSSYTTAYIQSISKKYTENKINPDWSLVVSDQILVNGNPITLIEGKVDALSKQMYSSKQAIKDATEAFAQFYLRKDGLPDASFSATDFRAPVTFRDRITDYNFRQGDFGGYGFGVYTDPDGNRVVEADILVGRTALRVNELIINQVEYVGGQKIYSAAAMTVSKVENTDTIWRCYFDNKQGAVRNMFLAGDLAFCQRFNGTEEGGYTTYWAKVTAIGSDYIELSKTDLMSSGSGSPAVGDNIIQLGNASDQDRQSAIILSSYGANSPSIRLYYGITDYTLANKDIFGVEYDSTNHIPYFYNYGSMRLGAREGEDGGYITYDHKTKQLNINAVVNFLPQSTGLEQMEAYQKLVQIAQGNIETWFYDGVSPIQSGAPTMSNYPVNTWEAADYENHIGDIYYSNTGKGYRFKRSGSTWEWEIISDTELAQLMADVQSLQYLKDALSNGTTTVAGGLILTSLIQLGYEDAENVRHTMAGISGLGQNSTAPAAWYGGPMVDHELNPDATEFAKSLFRFDGTGYLASGNITWDEKGYGQIGGEGDNYALKWNDKEVRIGPNIKLGAGDETIAMLANLLNMFELDTTSVAGKTLIHAKYDGLYSDGDIAAGGAWAGTPSGGGKTYLNELLDVQLATSSLNVGDMLMWNGAKYVNIPQSSITPDLSEYATQQWVLDKKYLTSHQTVTLASGTNNGTLKLTVGSTTTDNIAVKGLGSAAFTASSSYVDLTSQQTISGNKIFSGDVRIGDIGINTDNTGLYLYGAGHDKLEIYSEVKLTLLGEGGIYIGNPDNSSFVNILEDMRGVDENGSRRWSISRSGEALFSSISGSLANSLAIKLNGGTTEGTNLFTFNNISSKTIDITPSAIGAAAASHTHNYLPLSGGTLTGSISVASSDDTPLKLCGSADATRIALYDNANNFKAYIMYGWGSTFFTNQGSNNTQLGLTSGIPYYSPDNGGTKYTLLHAGNYNTYAPKLDGTGATGTWGINISGNADTLDGFHESSFSRHIEGVVFDVNTTKYYKLGNLPQSSSLTYDAFLIQGEIGGFLSFQKAVLNVSVGRRDGVIFCGYTQGLWNRNLGIDIGVNDAGEIVLIVTGPYCAWTLDLHTIQGTISYTGKTFTPTDTNFVLLSASNNVSKSLADGTVEKATKLQNSRTIWGQSFDGTGNVSGVLSDVNQVTFDANKTYGIFRGDWYSNALTRDDLAFSVPRAVFGGNVGIGTTSPSYKLDVKGVVGATKFHFDGDSNRYTEYGQSVSMFMPTSGGWAGGLTWLTNSGNSIFELGYFYDGGSDKDFFYFGYGASYSNPVNVMLPNGNIGIGTKSPSYKLHIVGTAYASENIIAAGDLTAGSDIRYKDKIQDLRLSVHDIALAPAFTYKWNNREDALVHIGSSAQYWLNTNAKDAVYYDKQNDFYHLNYASLALCNTIILARGMETQEEKIARLEERIKELEDKLRQYDSCR